MTGKAIAGAVGGGLAVVAFAAIWLVVTPPVHAAEVCRGQSVLVSYYGAESGSRTASGAYFDGTQLLAAHKSLPFGTRVRFTYRGKSIVVPILDRGPYIKGRVFDLSKAAAARIGMIHAGVARVCAERLN
jgi:rare lipoprotein A (peptidoglycan hydrolase)